METDLSKISELSSLKEKENQEFRLFLKGYDHYKVDEIVHKLNQKYLSEYDCTDCANCCKRLSPNLSREKIIEIADYLDISYEEFKEKYVEREKAEGFILKGRECPFLQDNKCSIYDHRPEACSSYPHLHKDNINHRLINIIDNSYICPIVYNILEDLKSELR